MGDYYCCYDFVGSSSCRFEGATISYCFLNKETDEIDDDRTIYTVKLTISGDGQSVLSELSAQSSRSYTFYKYLKVTAVSGTVTFIG